MIAPYGDQGWPGGDEQRGQPSLMASALRRRWRTMAAITVLVLLATFLFTSHQTKVYDASSSVVVQTPATLTSGANQGPNMSTEAQVADSLAVAQAVVQAEKLRNTTPAELLSHLSVTVPVDSSVLHFTYSSPQPKLAQQRAAAFAKAYLSFRHDQLAQQTLQAAADVQRRISSQARALAALRATFANLHGQQLAIAQARADAIASQIGLLQQKLGAMTTAGTYTGGALGPTPLPHSPAKPRMLVNMVVALMAGLLLGFLFAVAREYADPRIRGGEELSTLLGAPVLASIPAGRRVRTKTDPAGLVTLREPRSAGADAFRRLRSNLTFETDEAHMGSVLVTGVDVLHGATWVATNLAVALSTVGRRVMLVSADLERSNLRATFGVETAAGLVDVLRQTVDVHQAIEPAPVERLSLIDGQSDGVIAPGNRNNDDLVDPVKARRIIARASLKEDAVTVVEAPPIASCVDTAAWASACDGVVLVCDVRKTRRAEVIAARRQCEQARASVLGAVLLERRRTLTPPRGFTGWFTRPSKVTTHEPAIVSMTELGSTSS